MAIFNFKAIRLIQAALLITILSLFSAYYLQYVDQLTPCLLCVFQRWCLFVLLIVGLICLASYRQRFLFLACSLINVLFSLIGIFFAGRQIWLQHQTSPGMYSCLPDTNYLLKTLPIKQLVSLAYTGTSDCGIVHKRIVFLDLAEWALIGFVAVFLLYLFVLKHFFKGRK